MPDDQPNIFLFILDTVRSDHLSCYGHYRLTTPNIDQLASSGIVFENAFANSNWTPTSHGSIFTGELSSQSGIINGNHQLPSEKPSLIEIINNQGYSTFAASAGLFITPQNNYNKGVDRFIDLSSVDLSLRSLPRILRDRDLLYQNIRFTVRGHDTFTKYKFKKLSRFLDEGSQPLFGFINSKTPHHPYDPPRPFKSMFCEELDQSAIEIIGKIKEKIGLKNEGIKGEDIERLKSISQDSPLIGGEFKPSETEWEIIKEWYDASIRYVDEVIGDFISKLEDYNIYNDSIVIITSDHGEQFGEDGLEKHYFSLYDELLHVPLIISGGYIEEKKKVDGMVSLVDLFPTISKIAGCETNRSAFAEPLLPVKNEYHKYIVSEVGKKDLTPIRRKYSKFDGKNFENVRGPARAIRDKNNVLIESGSDDEIYNWKNNVSLDLKSNMSEYKKLKRVSEADLSPIPEWDPIDNKPEDVAKSRLKDLGYL